MTDALLVAVAGVLIASGVAHAAHFGRSRAGVHDHRLVPAGLAGPLVAALLATEMVLGVGTLFAVVTGSSAQLVWGLLCAVVFVAFTAYVHLAWLRRTRRDVMCACGVGEAPLGLWVTLRSGLLAVMALSGAVFASSDVGWLDRPTFEVTILVSAALALSIAVTLLPAARAPLGAVESEVALR